MIDLLVLSSVSVKEAYFSIEIIIVIIIALFAIIYLQCS